MFEAVPYLVLPASVEALDGRLKAGLSGWDEHRRHPEVQTHPGHCSKHVRMVGRSEEARVVVELYVAGQSSLAPVTHECLSHKRSADRSRRKRGSQTSMHRDDVENLYLHAAADDQVLHDVGLTSQADRGRRFEVDGAEAAVDLLRANGLEAARAEIVWNAIALHTSPGIAERTRLVTKHPCAVPCPVWNVQSGLEPSLPRAIRVHVTPPSSERITPSPNVPA